MGQARIELERHELIAAPTAATATTASWCADTARQAYRTARDLMPVREDYKDTVLLTAATVVTAAALAKSFRPALANFCERRLGSRISQAGVKTGSSLEYTIVPLSQENLPGAIKATSEGFRHGWPFLRPAADLKASLSPSLAGQVSGSGELNARYWVAIDKQNTVLGTTGLYETTKDAGQASWVGWLTVRDAYRGHGIGKALLNHTADTARAEGKDYLRLYTSTHRAEKVAQSLYESIGMKVVATERHPLPVSGLKIMIRELPLQIGR